MMGLPVCIVLPSPKLQVWVGALPAAAVPEKLIVSSTNGSDGAKVKPAPTTSTQGVMAALPPVFAMV